MSKVAIDRFVASLFGSGGASASVVLLAFGCFILVLLVFAAVNLIVIRARVRALSASLTQRDKAVSAVSGEVEAQSLLARQMSMDVEELRKRLAEHQQTERAEPPSWGPAAGPLNLNRRGQILRLSRKGKSISEIAQDLNVAQGEVELLLKVHDLGQKSPSAED